MNKKNTLIAALGILSQSSFAGTVGPAVSAWNFLGTLSLGPIWTSNAKAQTLILAPELEKTYTASKSSNTLFDGELFLGFQHLITDAVRGQLGLAVAATSTASFSGRIWDDADPEFNNFTYQYQIQHTHLTIKGKILFDAGLRVLPWLSASLGAAWNEASSFISTPKIFEAEPTPYFTDNTTTSFTYTVGAGVQYALNPNWQLGIGYEFADWGKSHFGRALGQTLTNGLNVNSVYTNGFLVNLTYII